MSFERIMGIHVTDDDGYQNYREGMLPILHSYGGSFGFDFKVSEVLKSKASDTINRVFTLEFPDRKAMDDFFSNRNYLKVKEQYFQNSVQSVTTISMHEKCT